MRRTLLISLLLALAVSALAGGRSGFRYVFSRESGGHTITHGSLDDLLRIHKRLDGRYLWARIDGLEYVIRDAALLAEVERATQPGQELEREYRALERRMKPLEDRQERIEEIFEEYEDRDESEPPNAAELRAELRAIERELRPYEREDARLNRREEELDRVFDAEVRRIVERAIRTGAAERFR